MIFVFLFSSISFLNIFYIIRNNTLNWSDSFMGIFVEMPPDEIPLDFILVSVTKSEKLVNDFLALAFTLLTYS
jgi:hypothetical protein